MKVDNKQFKNLIFLQSMKRICKGKYENVDPRNTKCLKLVGEYQKVYTHTLMEMLDDVLFFLVITNRDFCVICSALKE